MARELAAAKSSSDYDSESDEEVPIPGVTAPIQQRHQAQSPWEDDDLEQ